MSKELDILDEMEMDNLVSLLQDDDVFNELNKLDLGSHSSSRPVLDYGYTEQFDSDHLDLLGMNFLPNEIATDSTQNCSNTTHNDSHSDDLLVDHSVFLTSQSDSSQDVLSELFTTPSLPVTNPTDVSTSGITRIQDNVSHDHTYAATKVGVAHDSASSSAVLLSDSSSGKNSDTEEGSSDTGYDTMATSPSSIRSNTNSPRVTDSVIDKQSPTQEDTTVPNHTFSNLLTDPVKLIDERIKFFMSRQEVHLTEEEKMTLQSEGLPIPTTLPLTKTEEKALKSVRRKIRNKVAAQESRKKKKEYMHCLEEQVVKCTKENRELHKKVETLETENRTLLQQLAHLQTLVSRANPILGTRISVGTCLMVFVLCFGILFGNILPYRVSVDVANTDYTAAKVRSRALLSMDTSSRWTSWINVYKTLMPDHHNTADGSTTTTTSGLDSKWVIYCDNHTDSVTTEQTRHLPLTKV